MSEAHAVTEEGVLYDPQQCAGFFRRLGVDLVDVVVVFVLWLALVLIQGLLLDEETVAISMAASLAVVAFAYFVLLKRSPARTAGYRLFGVRIVDLQGRTPGIFALTARLGFAVFGPLNFLLDLLWIPGDPQKQALRDRFAETMVIRAEAHPVGSGPVVRMSWHVMGWTFIFPEVRRRSET